MNHNINLLGLIILIICCSCKELDQLSNTSSGYNSKDFKLHYAVNAPDTTIALAASLKEVSGLAYDSGRDLLLANNDEQGILFFLNKTTGKLQEALTFGKADDYEGLTYFNKAAYIIESNGNIKMVNTLNGHKIGKYVSTLSSKHDIEGICYNPINKRLLVAAKGNSRLHGNKASEKSIFEVNVEDGAVNSTPFLSINLHKSVKHLEGYGIDVLNKNKMKSRLKAFSPSGIAIHPKSNNLYILSARGGLLVVCDQSGSLLHVALLDLRLHQQAEGICFTPDGTMYISNEGKIGTGQLYKYSKN